MTLIYKIKYSRYKNIEVRYLHYHKKEDIFTFIVPVFESVLLEGHFILCVTDLITDKYSEEYCQIINKQYAENDCKIIFKIKSRGARFLQDAINNNNYMEED